MAPSVENADFDICNRREIIFILEDLAKHRVAINLEAAGGAVSLTNVLAVSPDGNHVYLDISQDAVLNEQIIKSVRVTFSSQIGVRVRWHTTRVSLVALPDGGAFSIEVPEVVERIQRRDYFRLSVAHGGKGLNCKMPLGGSEFLAVPIVDMSIGGIGISIRGAPPLVFSQGAVIAGCAVEFPEVGIVLFTLRVCGMWVSSTAKSGEEMYHIGLEFVDLSRSVENLVTHHVIHLERELLSHS